MAAVFNVSSGKSFFLGGISITAWIVAVNFFVFLISLILVYANPDFIKYVALQPNSAIQGEYLWTLVTSMFTHLAPWHLFVNMLSLLFVGSFVERIIGKKRYIWFYIISGLFASLFFILFSILFGNNPIGQIFWKSGDICFGSLRSHIRNRGITDYFNSKNESPCIFHNSYENMDGYGFLPRIFLAFICVSRTSHRKFCSFWRICHRFSLWPLFKI